jgi:hypothetical protein
MPTFPLSFNPFLITRSKLKKQNNQHRENAVRELIQARTVRAAEHSFECLSLNFHLIFSLFVGSAIVDSS